MSESTRNDRTKDFLDAIRAKVKDTEERRPDYNPDDLDSVTKNITWGLSALGNYNDLSQALTDQIRHDHAEGKEPAAGLPEELEATRKKVTEVLQFNSDLWRTFTALTDEIKAAAKRQELEAQQNYLLSGNDTFVPLLNGELTNIIFNLSLDDFEKDPYSKTATCRRGDVEITIENYPAFVGNISGSPLKLFDAAVVYLTANNYYSAKNSINSIVEIPLTQYAKTRGIDLTPRTMNTPEEQRKENQRIHDRKKKFKKDIERDMSNLELFKISGRVKRGKNAGDFMHIGLISSGDVVNDKIQIVFDPRTAQYLVNSYIMSYAPQLQTLDDRNPNLYRIGRKMLLQSSIDNNNAKGTQNTLKVKTIVASAPAIPTPDELKQRGQRNWRDKTKRPVEVTLNGIRESGLVTRWEYEDPRTKKTLTPEAAAKLSANDYMNLNVNFALIDNPAQIARGIRKAEEKAAALEDKSESGKKKKPAKKKTNPHK